MTAGASFPRCACSSNFAWTNGFSRMLAARAFTSRVTLFRTPLGRPRGFPEAPFRNDRPRGALAVLPLLFAAGFTSSRPPHIHHGHSDVDHGNRIRGWQAQPPALGRHGERFRPGDQVVDDEAVVDARAAGAFGLAESCPPASLAKKSADATLPCIPSTQCRRASGASSWSFSAFISAFSHARNSGCTRKNFQMACFVTPTSLAIMAKDGTFPCSISEYTARWMTRQRRFGVSSDTASASTCVNLSGDPAAGRRALVVGLPIAGDRFLVDGEGFVMMLVRPHRWCRRNPVECRHRRGALQALAQQFN